MKPCIKCGVVKSLDEFYVHPRMTDGHLNVCKPCVRKSVRANRRSKIDSYREYDRARFRADPTRRSGLYASSAELRRIHPEKYRARTAVGNALRDGRLVRQPGEVCGSPKSEAHHDDYSKPLEVRWLCRVDHEAAHHPLERSA